MIPARSLPLVFALALSLVGAQKSIAQDGKESGGSSLGDLFNKVKELKVPDSVTSLPTQLQELKESYLKTAETVDALRTEVGTLRSEVEALKNENARLQQAVGDKVAANDRSALLKPVELSADELATAWRTNKDKATTDYAGRYLKVVGIIEAFESASQDVIVILKTNTESRVRCFIRRDASFHVEVLASQGRLVNRNDRTTILATGQPVAVLGTCEGMELDVRMVSCSIEGLEVRKIEAPKAQN
jgi:regulator of replication initiation timing